MNRLTITLDDDLYAMARAYAVANRKSLSKAIGELLRQRTAVSRPPAMSKEQTEQDAYYDPVLGIQVSRCEKPLTEEDLRRSLDDEDARHLEVIGRGTGRPERSPAR